MKLKDYIGVKGGKYLSETEAKIFGIDTNKGWVKRYFEKELTQDQINKAARYMVHSIHSSKTLKDRMRLLIQNEEEKSDDKYLYLMQNINGMLKIGISIDPIKRARQLTTGSGVKVECIGIWKTSAKSSLIEGRVIKTFSEFSLEGEWFLPFSIDHQDVEDNIECSFTRISIDGLFNEEAIHPKIHKKMEKLARPSIDFREYMIRRGSKGLTKVEIALLGIDSSKKGWMKRNFDKVIEPSVIDKCIKAILESPATGEKAKKYAKNFWRSLQPKDYYNFA